MPTTETMNAWGSPFLLVPLALGAIAFLVGLYFRRRPRLTIESFEIARQERESSVLRCVCGDTATHPSPILERSRGDILRSYFGAPPRYKRTVDPEGTLVYCRHHAHYADVEADKFVYDLRAEQAATNATIAARAANFEQEGLARKVADSLTEEQKRAKRTSNVRQLVSNGN
jgi:hypothetical protein